MSRNILQKFEALPIKWKVITVIVIVATLISGSEIALYTTYDTKTSLRHMQMRTKTIANVIGDNVVPSLIFKDRHDAAEVLGSLDNETSVEAAYLYSAEGVLIGRYPSEGGASTPAPPQVSRDADTEEVEGDKLTVVHR